MKPAKGSRRNKLEAEGWTRQFIASEPRLSEAKEAYEEMGLEVRFEPVDKDDLDQECTECFEMDESCHTIYTRSRREGKEAR
jgi:hypothetical protein